MASWWGEEFVCVVCELLTVGTLGLGGEAELGLTCKVVEKADRRAWVAMSAAGVPESELTTPEADLRLRWSGVISHHGGEERMSPWLQVQSSWLSRVRESLVRTPCTTICVSGVSRWRGRAPGMR